jgi:hypothetical protein
MEQVDRCRFAPAPYGGRMLSIHLLNTFAKVYNSSETAKYFLKKHHIFVVISVIMRVPSEETSFGGRMLSI